MHQVSATIKNIIDNTPGYSLSVLMTDLGIASQAEQLISLDSAAKMLAFSRRHVERMIEAGTFSRIKGKRIVRLRVSEINAWIAKEAR